MPCNVLLWRTFTLRVFSVSEIYIFVHSNDTFEITSTQECACIILI